MTPTACSTPGWGGCERRGARRRALTGRALPTALLLSGGFIVAADNRVVALLLPAIADDFHVSIGAAGSSIAFYSVAYAAGQLFYGPLGDRVGKVRVIRVVLVLFAVGTILCAVAPSLTALLALRLLTGAAGAAVIPMSLAYLGDTVEDYPARQRAIGVFLSAIVSGQVVGQALGGVLAGLFSWRAIFVLLGATAFALTAAIWSYPAPPAVSEVIERRPFRQIFAADRPLFLLTLVETFCFLGAFSFAGASLVEEHGASYPLVGALLGCFAVGSVAASRATPRIAAGAADATRLAVGAYVMAASFALLATTPAAPLFGLSVLGLGLGFTFAHSALQTRTTEVSPQTRGTAVSLFAGIANVGAAAGTFAAGAAVDAFGYSPLFATAAGGLVLLAAVVRSRLPPRAAAPHGPARGSPSVPPGAQTAAAPQPA